MLRVISVQFQFVVVYRLAYKRTVLTQSWTCFTSKSGFAITKMCY